MLRTKYTKTAPIVLISSDVKNKNFVSVSSKGSNSTEGEETRALQKLLFGVFGHEGEKQNLISLGDLSQLL